MNVKETFPLRLKEARKMRKMTQCELAKKSGIPTSSIGQFETGARMPSVETLVKLVSALNVTTDNLLGMPLYDAYLETEDAKLSKEQIDTVNALMGYWRSVNDV